jgi:hypothetical protein
MAPNAPTAHFCAKCGAPLSSYASTGPFEHLFAEGSVYRQAAERPRSFVVVLGIWLIFGSVALASIFMIVAMPFMPTFVFCGFLLAISIVMIAKTTRNYVSREKTRETHDA